LAVDKIVGEEAVIKDGESKSFKENEGSKDEEKGVIC